MKKTFYITTTLPYVNAEPHIGFALEMVQADTIARYWRTKEFEVIFNTGTDEHGLKIYQEALKSNKNPQEYCDEYAAKFEDLKKSLNLSYTNFIRTTDPDHKKAAQEFWKRCKANGYIYKKDYKIKYCVGCELEKTDSELSGGKCPLHPNREIDIIEEENYFFAFSKFQKSLLDLYHKNPQFVVPSFRLKEIRNFVAGGLEDFSISRLKSKMPWGVNVPDDSDHVMYVWFDALINYISTLGWPNDDVNFSEFWPGMQIAGKDNLRQQSAMWQAMLMGAGLPNSRQILVHGFITSEGQKMSKSVGNVVDPLQLVNKYGTDAIRYYLLREVPVFDDGDFSYSRMDEVYNSDLANELGNLLSRLTTLGQEESILTDEKKPETIFDTKLQNLIESFEFNKALEIVGQSIKKLNKEVDAFAPWKKVGPERKEFLIGALQKLNHIGYQLAPFIPETAEKIQKATSSKISKAPPLFPKK